jgi:hypothetical protein
MTKALYWLALLCTALPAQDWKQALTFHASFDKGLDADFALGDKRIYTAPVWSAKTTFRHLSPCSRTVHKRFRMFGIPEGPNFCGAQAMPRRPMK